MIDAVMETGIAPPGTGASFCDWWCDQLAESRPRTGQSPEIIYVSTSFHPNAAADLFEQSGMIVTDSNAQKRSSGLRSLELARNFSQMMTAATLIIPGLREMLPAERSNLRNFYKKLYRKV